METKGPEELCFIDSGIKSLHSVALHSDLQVLNLHCNEIKKIENLEGLQSLKHLDLSSNQISDISGLDYLFSLRTLNLSCNLIHAVQGLENLRSLVKLNLSYNQIANISGLQATDGPEYKLSHLELQGNCLLSLDHIGRCLEGATNLRRLVLSQAGAQNPCCNQKGYRDKLFAMLPQLEFLDGTDRHGNVAVNNDILADIPGLDQYLEYLLSNNGSEVSDVVTPKIDAALEAFHQRAIITSDITSSAVSDQDSCQHADKEAAVAAAEIPKLSADRDQKKTKNDKLSVTDLNRLEKLESQMINLLYSSRELAKESTSAEDQPSSSASQRKSKSTGNNSVKKHAAKRDIDATDESDEDISSPSAQNRTRSRKVDPRVKSGSKLTRSGQPNRRVQQPGKRDVGKLIVRGRSPNSPSRRQDGRRAATENGIDPSAGKCAAYSKDERMRDSVQETYVQIMQELETERERRWKAEEAARRLVEHIKQLETKAREEESLQDTAVQVTTRLKQALTNEREASIRLRSEVDDLKKEVQRLTSQLEASKKSEHELQEALRTAQETAISIEKEHLRKQAHEAKKLQEATMRAAATSREVEILQNNVRSLEGQIQQLQQLLAAREQEHRKELEGCHTLGSPRLQELIQNERRSVEEIYQKKIEEQKEKYKQLSHDYESLEDEFRMALQIETSRFQELQTAFEKVSQELAQTKQMLATAQQKEEKSTALISELTSLVKEQKGRLAELSKAKQEQQHEYKERVQNLESHLEEARRRMVTLELLKQEKVKLQSQVQAQLSLIEGLRAEKKLWGDELVHQESSLAQDRGRMEAKIEALSSEVAMLKKQLQQETDAVRIKAKMIEDQTETIRKLKEALQERDAEIRKAREETLKIQRELEEQLSAEMIANQELQEKLEHARERKDQLKSEIARLEDELEESKSAHSALNKKWKEKSSLIAQLEEQVMAMKESWENKEKRLIEERDKAVHAATLAVEKLRSIDDAFRKQLENKEESHQRALEALRREKQEEVDMANKRVLEVEEEMRLLLRETEANKRLMEEKVKKLSKAFTELQQI